MRQLLFLVALSIANAASAQLTFTTHFPPLPPQPSVELLVSVDANVVYAVSHDMLYRSNDGGATFTNLGRARPLVAIDPADPNVLYDAQQGDVRRSDDGGVTWKSIQSNLPNFTPTPTQLLVTPNGMLYLASTCYRDHTGGGVFRSDNRGGWWSGNLAPSFTCVRSISVDPLSGHIYSRFEYGSYAGDDPASVPTYKIVASARDPNMRYGIGSDLLVSSDGGSSWVPSGIGALEIELDDATDHLFVVTAKGLYMSSDRAASWSLVPDAPFGTIYIGGGFLYVRTSTRSYRAPLSSLGPFMALGDLPSDVPTAVTSLAVDPNGEAIYAAGPGVWRSRDSGQRWEAIDGGDKTPRRSIAVDGISDLYAIDAVSSASTKLWHYTADGGTWDTFATELAFARRLVADPARRGVLYATTPNGLFVSEFGGHSWRRVDELGAIVSDVVVDPKRAGLVYAAGSPGLFTSADGGASWRRLNALGTSRIVVAPSRPETLYRIVSDVAVKSTMQRSDDSGATWRDVSVAPLGNVLVVDPLNEDLIWTDNLIHSADGGATWSAGSGNLPSVFVIDAVIDRDGTHLHVVLDPFRADLAGEYDALLRGGHHRAGRK